MQPLSSPQSQLEPRRHRPLRRSEYERLVEAGCFTDERLELVEGELLQMSPHGSEHALAIQVLTRVFTRALADDVWVRVQLPLAVSETSEPEPDLAIVPAGDYGSAHPQVALLVIEVAKSSTALDLEKKAAIYARADVAEYWVLDLTRQEAVVHRRSLAGRWTQLERFGRESTLTPQRLPQVAVRLADLLRTQ
jgi:Uma2 family endonuclease